MATILAGPAPDDYWMERARLEIQDTYRQAVRVKSKSLRKFGRTLNADAGTPTTVMTLPGASQYHETYSTTNDIDAVSSSATADTGPLVVEGHYYDESNNLVFAIQTVTLDGRTPVALGTSLCRATRAYRPAGTFASPTVDLTGNIYVFASDGVTVTNGVPQTNSAVKLVILAGINQSEKCATSLSYQDYWIITSIGASCQRGNSSTVSADLELEWREQGGVFRPIGTELSVRTGGSQSIVIEFRPYVIVPPNSDVRLVVTSNTNDTTASGFIAGQLALVYG